MHYNSKLIVTILVLLQAIFAAPAAPTNKTYCTYNGIKGECMHASRCNSVIVSGRCPGSNAIKCCLPIISKQPCHDDKGNMIGFCMKENECSSGTVLYGKCQNGDSLNYHCCVTSTTTTPATTPITTIIDTPTPTTTPTTTIIDTPKPTITCTFNGRRGICMKVNQCKGKLATGLCPGDNSIKCCY